jgi:8-amino-7-oxononanoate synthase
VSHWDAWASKELQAIRAQGRWRELTTYDGDGVTGVVDGRQVISFASNDYLGLSSHPQVRAAAHDAIDRWGTGAPASRLVVGTRPVHEALEREIAEWKNVDGALVCPTGFSANLAVMTTFGVSGVTIFSDALNHASIIDGCRQSRAQVQIYRHADADHLETLLATVSGPKIVVTDSVFSMDGDVAPLQRIVQLCIRHGALLVVDEAHAVLGPELTSVEGLELLRIGTLSKTFGAQGGWIAGSRSLIDLLINRGRAFIFTTALSPADAAAALAALQIYRGEEGTALRARLRQLIDLLLPGHPSPIVPFVLGQDSVAVAMASKLLQAGFWVPAIRPPTVPAGTARLRITLSASHTPQMVASLKAVLPKDSLDSLRNANA